VTGAFIFGTIINAAAIVLGSVVGLIRKTPMTGENQLFFKVGLGLATIVFGLRLTAVSLHGPVKQILVQIGIVLLAMTLGKLTGKLLHLQKLSNRLGKFARERIAALPAGGRGSPGDGVNVCAALFCAAPLGIIGAISESLGGGPWPLLVKAAMDGLAAFGFVAMFGWAVALSALPVLAFQGAISLLVMQFAQPYLAAHQLTDSVNATAGLLVFCVSLLIFEVKRVEVADYLPSLAWAPLLTLWLR
jgi:uncharacterized membrane protein YqgA involved in biofilm formation